MLKVSKTELIILGGSVKPYDHERAGTKTVQFFDLRYVMFDILCFINALCVFIVRHYCVSLMCVFIVYHYFASSLYIVRLHCIPLLCIFIVYCASSLCIHIVRPH